MLDAYYNEWEKYPAAWLRNLMLVNEIPDGVVNETDIRKIKAEDIQKYDVCHFFAGIGGWAYALKLAGWPEDRAVWTGSCPCQPFSVAGKQQAQADERHLWPVWFELIKKCRPPTIFGEQVAGAIALGWLDDVYKGLEAEGYAVASAVLPACSVGAPHKRDRVWFVADARYGSIGTRGVPGFGEDKNTLEAWPPSYFITASSDVADANNARPQGRDSAELQECAGQRIAGTSSASNVTNTNCKSSEWFTEPRSKCSLWNIEPALGRVANGIPARAHKLRAYGNAIVPQVAAAFIRSFLEAEKEL